MNESTQTKQSHIWYAHSVGLQCWLYLTYVVERDSVLKKRCAFIYLEIVFHYRNLRNKKCDFVFSSVNLE